MLALAFAAAVLAAPLPDPSGASDAVHAGRSVGLLAQADTVDLRRSIIGINAEIRRLESARVSRGGAIAFTVLGGVGLGLGGFWTIYGLVGLAALSSTGGIPVIILIAGVVGLVAGIVMLAVGLAARGKVDEHNEPIDARIRELEARRESYEEQLGSRLLPGSPPAVASVTVATF